MEVKTPHRSKRSGPRALSLIEQAVHLLRRNNAVALAEYYIGAMPFVLGFLYFWSDMSRNPMAAWYCGPSAAGMALLFIWMKFWQTRFCRRLWCHLQKDAPEKWPWKRTLLTTARQTALHATGVVILPLSVIILFPFAWVYAFYQNLCVVDDPQPKGMLGLARAAKQQSILWPGQNHLMLVLVSLFSLFVFLNLGVGLILVPHLLKKLLGIDTVFTLSGMRILNTTFVAVLGGLSYLCLDPILKAIYVLRCFYGRSLRTGDDLKSALRPFITIVLSVFVITAVFIPQGQAFGEGPDVTDPWKTVEVENGQHYVDQLNGHIESVLEQRRFAWRLPREEAPEPEETHGWIGTTIEWIGEKCRSLFRTVGGWIEDVFEWLIEKMPKPKISPNAETGDYREVVRWVFYAMGFGLTLWLIYWLVRWFRQHRPVRAGHVEQAMDVGDIDLTDESVTAEDLPLDRWLAMAHDMMARKDFRKALRALYLSVLALLADHQRLQIAPYKSNREYAAELARRSHAEPELLEKFDWCIHAFERSWYGMHPVGKEMLDQFVEHQERLATIVQPATA